MIPTVVYDMAAFRSAAPESALRLARSKWPSISPWQWAVIWELVRDDPFFEQQRKLSSPHSFHNSFGVRVNFGRRNGHSTLARTLLASLPKAMLVVPSEDAPFSRKQLHAKALTNDGLFGLVSKIWVSRPVDVVTTVQGEPVRDEILGRTISPFAGSEYCIVDDASFMSQDELRLLRSVPWKRYVELA